MGRLRDYIGLTPVRKAFFDLLGGNVIVFAAHLLTLYVILQLYSKEALSQYTIFVALVYLTTKLVNFRLPDSLIREPSMDIVIEHTRHIFTLTIGMTIASALVYGLLVMMGINFQLFVTEDRSIIFGIFVFCVLLNSLNQLFSTLLLKRNKTKQLSYARIVKVGMQLVLTFVLVNIFSFGLILALLGASLIEFICYLIWSQPSHLRLSSLSEVFSVIKSNKDILLYTLPISLLISIHDNLIIQSIEYFYGAGALAVFAIADRVLRIPAAIIGGAANMTLFKYGSDTFHTSPATYLKQFKRGTLRMFVFFIVAAVCCMLLAYPVFTSLFDLDWLPSADLLIKYAWWIIPFSMIGILRSVPVMLKKQKQYFIIELVMVIVLAVAFWVAGNSIDFGGFLQVKFGLELIFYGLMIGVIYYLVKSSSRSHE